MLTFYKTSDFKYNIIDTSSYIASVGWLTKREGEKEFYFSPSFRTLTALEMKIIYQYLYRLNSRSRKKVIQHGKIHYKEQVDVKPVSK